MSAVRSFDSLGYYERLTKAGVPEAQARVQVEVMQGIVHNYDEASHREFPSKGDLAETRTTLQQEIVAVRVELKQEIADVRTELQQEIVAVRVELKQEIADVRTELQQEIAAVRTELKQEIAAVRTELQQEIAETKHEILKWVVGAALAQTAVIVAIIGVCAAFFLQMH
ncbi:MAG: DUF1640 domain-containing protein [Desulfovibrio sp.]|nr:DUF1640 domain-containing protein [Desulfovibrio sp.]